MKTKSLNKQLFQRSMQLLLLFLVIIGFFADNFDLSLCRKSEGNGSGELSAGPTANT